MTTGESSEMSADLESARADSNGGSESGSQAFASALAALTAAQESSSEELGDDDKGTSGESQKTAPKDLASVAKRLGVKVEDLYAVTVPASAGREAMTIGQIKDRFAEFSSLEADRLAFTETRTKQEGDLEIARQEFQELLAIIPKEQLTGANLQKVAQRLTDKARAEGARVLELIPEWKDVERYRADSAEIVESLRSYGLPQNFLGTVRNAGLVKFIRDAVQREKLVRKALEGVRKVPSKKTTTTTATRAAPNGAPNNQQRPSLRPVSGRERFAEALNKHR